MRDRVRDYVILLAVSALLTFPNLGACSLWDFDEGVNAQAAREMHDADSWIIPTFNYQLRTAKPVMLYWLQRISYTAFGVSEWSARLPSVLAACLAVLLTYELARRMFDRRIGLLAGVVLASVVQFGVLSHAATPDATLLAFSMLTYLAFWVGHGNGSRRWWLPTAAACGLAVLTKGPVGVALPGLVIFAYFAWNRELSRLLDRRIIWSALVLILVAGPWYGLVSAETRGEWLMAFFGNENVNRFLTPLEGHRGPPWFYPVAILVMFAPWTAFLGAACWYGVKATKPEQPVAEATAIPEAVRAHRFLVCWVAAYLLVFTAAATKLPNYVFPLYPALAILTARFLVTWREGTLTVPQWVMTAGTVALSVVGIVYSGGLGYVEWQFPGILMWSLLGIIPVSGAIGMAYCLRRDDRAGFVNSATVASVVFIAAVMALPPLTIDRQKAPRELVRASGMADPGRDVRVAAFGWFQPSAVFYAGREIDELKTLDDAALFLSVATPGYLFVSATAWEELSPRVAGPYRVAARHFDFLRNCEVLVILNAAANDVASR